MISSAAADHQSANQVRDDLRCLRDIGPQNSRLSTNERDELEAIKDRLRKSDPREVVSGIAENIHEGKPNREIPAYRKILPDLPSIKQEMLRRISSEADAHTKAGLINCMWYVKGADVIRVLVAQFEDWRFAAPGSALSDLRVCDTAFNVVYVRVAHIQELGFDYTSAMSDSIVPDVPLEWRDPRIAKLKAALVAKYGPELKLPDQI